jgi:hypothetical protein
MKKIKIIIAILCLYTSLVGSANAGLITKFELECTACGTFGDFNVSWLTTQDATLATGFNNYSPGNFFSIAIPEIAGALFWAHSAAFGGGYNWDINDISTVAMAPGSVIFTGPTSAPIWKDGVYNDVVNYFQSGTDQGHSRLTISTVPVPSTLAIFALGVIGLASRRFKKQS